MSEHSAIRAARLNLRGPLLAAAIFATVFAVVLLIAHQNESDTSDMGSSLRQDPYGTSLVFDSYERAGYRVERSEDEDGLLDQDASRTTAFFVGGYPQDDFEITNGRLHDKGSFLKRVEDFLSRGGRVVLITSDWSGKSKSQGWEVATDWHQAPHGAKPDWIPPNPDALAAGSEMIYIAPNTPWLTIDQHWSPLYSKIDEDAAAGSPPLVYMAMRQAGKGEIVVASKEWFLLNEVIKTHPNPVLLDFLAGGRPVIWVDETLHGLEQERGLLWLVRRYRLQPALLIFWAALLGLLWSMSGDLVRRPARDASSNFIRSGEAAGVASRRLLERSVTPERLVAECWDQFRRRAPQDAGIISADPSWGPRLRAALGQTPLTGYTELAKIIAERRASAKWSSRSA
jgi:hypothetical protein